jgi:NADH-quinone oxidoreductase subunit N
MSPVEAPLAAALSPLWALVAGALVLLGVEVLGREKGRRAAPVLTAAILAAALAADLHLLLDAGGAPGPLFGGALVVDRLALAGGAVVLLSALLAVGAASSYLRRERAVTGEFYALLLFASSGAWIMTAAEELLTLFIGLELLSLPAYCLAGYLRGRGPSSEAALKYLLPGAAASGFLVYGSALLYGATGTTSYAGIRAALSGGMATPALLLAGGALVLGALAFKVAAVPFHAWAPDVYEGAPAPSAAFLSTGVKTAAFIALYRAFVGALGPLPGWGNLLGILAVLTLALGNLGALAQSSVKRMLAYSSVAHAGYLLVGFSAVGSVPGGDLARGLLLYLTAYTCMTGGAFVFLAGAAGPGEPLRSFDDFAGYAARRPLTALALTVLLFSLAGMPPTAGFFGKYLLFRLAVEAGRTDLVVLALLFTLLSFAYYLRWVVAMYMKPAAGTPATEGLTAAQQAALWVCVLGTLTAGLLPSPF